MKFKKAAMFGLDARIALAIFGALSVISGAALYSAIQNSRVVRAVVQLEEVNKAIEQYMLDTGTDIPIHSGANYVADLEHLVTSSTSGWRGSYFQGKYNNVYVGFETDFPSYDSATYNVILRTDVLDILENLGGALGANNTVACSTSSEACYYWTRLAGLKDNGFAEAIDLYVDGAITPNTGKVRTHISTPSNAVHIWLRGPKTLS